MLFKLSNITNRITVFVFSILSFVIVTIIILFAIILININYEEQEKQIKNGINQVIDKTRLYIYKIKFDILAISSFASSDYSLYEKNLITSEELLEQMKYGILLNAQYIENGNKLGVWFEPNVFKGMYLNSFVARKHNDTSFIDFQYTSPNYNYFEQNWYQELLPPNWNRELPLFNSVVWSKNFVNRENNQKSVIAASPINFKNKIIGLTTIHFDNNDFQTNLKYISEPEDYAILLVSDVNNQIIFKNTANPKTDQFNKDIVKTVSKFKTKNNSQIQRTNIKLFKEDYILYYTKIQDDFTLIISYPRKILFNKIIKQLLLISAFSIVILATIIFGFIFSYRKVLEHSEINENLMNYYRSLFSIIPNSYFIFDQSGILTDHNLLQNSTFRIYQKENIDLQFMLNKIIGYYSDELPDNLNLQELDNLKFYNNDVKKYFLLKFTQMNFDKQNFYFFIFIDITELKTRENDIEKLNRSLEETVHKRTIMLENAMNSLQEMNIKLNKNYESMRKVNEELIQSEVKLKELIDTKDKFISIIAHDIKNPIHSSKMVVDIIKNYQKMMTHEEANNYYDKLSKTLDSIAELIENILMWSKAQSNSIEISPEIINLKESIDNSIKIFEAQLQPKSIKINNIVPNDLTVKIDKNMLSLIIRNLISNSIKFSHPNSEITIQLDTNYSTNKHLFTIQDNGIGMNEQIKNNLFSLTQNPSQKGTMGEKGTGLGMILTAEFIRLLNEKIWVESQINQGTKFYLTISKYEE